MAITATTLSGAIGVSDLTIAVGSATGFADKNLIRIDNEWMIQKGAAVGTTINVVRGKHGTAQAAHNLLAAVVTGLASDFPGPTPATDVPPPPQTPETVYYGASGAIAVPVKNTIAILNKAGVAVMTLAAPGLGSDGVQLTITSETAQAHTLTATTLLADAVSGSPHTTGTFAAYKGSTVVLTAANGLWNVTSAVGVTVT